MSKSITVSSVAYVHAEDVDPEKHISAIPINEAMKIAVVRAINALENPTGAYTDFQRATMQTCLRSAQSTHAAIRKVLAWGEEEPMSVDALALARLPLESLYNMCMFTEGADWVDVYVRDGWKKQYEQFLLQKAETTKLKRYDEYSNKTGPHHLAAVGKTIGITKAQVATIEHEQLNAPMPVGVAQDHIPQFPTPGKAINKLPKGGDKRRMLERLYPEYVFLCSFAHGLPDANLFKMMFNKDSKFRDYWSDAELKDTFRRNVAERSYVTSLLSMIQSAAEITALYPTDVELLAGVTKAWEETSRDSLLGKAIWNIRTKKLLGVIDTPPAEQGATPNA
jgi:hypothetical protein